jgi:hypothetical protein
MKSKRADYHMKMCTIQNAMHAVADESRLLSDLPRYEYLLVQQPDAERRFGFFLTAGTCMTSLYNCIVF